MNLDKFGNVIVNDKDAFTALYNGTLSSLETLRFSSSAEIEKFNHSVNKNGDGFPKLSTHQPPSLTIEEFDSLNQENWFMPEEYRTYDIVDWLYCQCRTLEQKDRVTEELTLYAQHNMIILLKYLKYLVDTMRSNNIVWGVGRGSSVASYVLFLLGVHKVDSIKYNLDIREFLK